MLDKVVLDEWLVPPGDLLAQHVRQGVVAAAELDERGAVALLSGEGGSKDTVSKILLRGTNSKKQEHKSS